MANEHEGEVVAYMPDGSVRWLRKPGYRPVRGQLGEPLHRDPPKDEEADA